jgi:hypothetical protein
MPILKKDNKIDFIGSRFLYFIGFTPFDDHYTVILILKSINYDKFLTI